MTIVWAKRSFVHSKRGFQPAVHGHPLPPWRGVRVKPVADPRPGGIGGENKPWKNEKYSPVFWC